MLNRVELPEGWVEMPSNIDKGVKIVDTVQTHWWVAVYVGGRCYVNSTRDFTVDQMLIITAWFQEKQAEFDRLVFQAVKVEMDKLAELV